MPKPNPLMLPWGVREQVTLQALTGPQDAAGQPSWQQVCSMLGVVSTLSSREVYQAQQFSAQVTHSVAIMYPAGVAVSGGMRLLFRSRVFTIQAIENVQERNKVLKLMCIEIDGVQ
jgi:SPP1 family predicted phage head-tail adaptor